MKNLIIISLLFFATLGIAQNNNVALGTFIPEEIEPMPASAKQVLNTRLGQIITKNGISDVSYNSRFIITPNVSVISKDVVASAPPKIAYNLDVTLYIGDGLNGTLYSSRSFNVKGVGNNETKAYIAAIKQLRANSNEMQSFVSEGKEKIIDFYNTNCEMINKEATSLANQNRYEEALNLLVNIPSISSCFDKSQRAIKNMYQNVIDRNCKLKVAEATAIWNADQDIYAANKAGAILESIEPSSKCYSEVKSLFSKIEKRVKQMDNRKWDYKLKVLDTEITAINAATDILKVYAQNQPKNVIYNVRGWY